MTDRPTAPDVEALLTQLEASHAAVQPPVSVLTGLAQDSEYATDVNSRYADGGSAAFAECYGEESAALIVAAVNAMPRLVGAVRAVLALHSSEDRGAGARCKGCATHVSFRYWPCPTVDAVTAALAET